MWAILAFAEMGDGARATDLFALINPINHARTPAEVQRYKVEPYVAAADVHSVAPHAGRGGWMWYTGSAAWMYRAGIEGILGLRPESNFLVVAPCIPPSWPGFSATVTLRASRLPIPVSRGDVSAASLYAVSVEARAPVRVPIDGRSHDVQIVLPPGSC